MVGNVQRSVVRANVLNPIWDIANGSPNALNSADTQSLAAANVEVGDLPPECQLRVELTPSSLTDVDASFCVWVYRDAHAVGLRGEGASLSIETTAHETAWGDRQTTLERFNLASRRVHESWQSPDSNPCSGRRPDASLRVGFRDVPVLFQLFCPRRRAFGPEHQGSSPAA